MKYFLLIIATFFSCSATVFAQTDSTQIQYSEETETASDFKLKETYNYLIRAQVEEKTLLKIGVHGFGMSHSGSYLKYGIGFEQKIKPSFSVLAELQHTLEKDWPLKNNPTLSFNIGARYYYNINARIRKGKSANNFSANYLGVLQQNMMVKVNENYQYQSNVNLLYGLQRRIGKYGFVDFGFGPVLQLHDQKNRISFNLLFSIGLAF